MGFASWQIELTRPFWLAALAVLPVLVYYSRRSLVHLPRGRRATALVVRSLLVVLVIIALCGPRLDSQTGKQCIVAVVDDSLSVLGASLKTAAPFEEEAGRYVGGETKGLWFAREYREFSFPRKAGWVEDICPDRRGTNIAAAITAARAMIPANRVGQIVLFSDGNQTEGDALAAAKVAGVPISTVPMPGPENEVYVSAIHAPPEVRQGEPFSLEAIVQSMQENDGRIVVLRGTEVVLTEPKHLAKGENRFGFTQTAIKQPATVFTVRVEGFKDTLADNNTAGAIVMVRPKPRVLLVESQPVLAEKLAAALKGENVDVEVRPPQDLPARLEDLQAYELLILSNVPATSLPTERMEVIRHYVHDYGGGLIAVGGDQAFTPGGYRSTVLEDVLPVISEARKDKPRPGLAMVVVIDCSYSMKGRSIDLARQATRRAVEMLGPRDQVGVLAFEDRSRWISPLGPATNKERILRQIDTIEAAGGTNMFTAIEQAYLALNEAYADLKHIIVLTDGISHPGDFDALTKDIAAAGITVSTVGVGDEPARPLLEGIARRSKGHSYFVDDVAALPKIFEIETIGATKTGITEEPFFPQVVRPTEVLSGLDFAHVPTLLGYAETRAKPAAEVILSSKSTAGEPILASWRYGRGTSVAFTSDIQSRWAAAWLRWPGFSRFWVQLVRQTMRRDGKNCRLDVAESSDRFLVTLDAADSERRFVNGAEATIKVEGPDGKTRELPLPQVAPGQYAAWVARVGQVANPPEPASKTAPSPGQIGNLPHDCYYFETRLTREGKLLDVERRGIVAGYPDELRVRPTNTALLRAIAEVSGGRYDPKPADVFAASDRTAPWDLMLWPFLLAAGIGLFVVDVAVKRVNR